MTDMLYKTILLTLDTTPKDRALIDHIKALARAMQSRVILFHVADGWAAKTFGADAISAEITEDHDYLRKVAEEFRSAGVAVDAEMAYGVPAEEIVKRVKRGDCDLLAMTTHGHRFIADLLFGTTATPVRHTVDIPILFVKAK